MLNPFKLLDRPAKPESVETPLGGFQRDPFKAVPVLNERAEVRKDSRACCQVRMRQEPATGMASFMARRFGLHRDMRVDLDPQGSFFWSQVDGRRDLYGIEKQMRKQFALAPEESRKATLLFTRMLMLRQLILLDVDGKRPKEEPPVPETVDHV